MWLCRVATNDDAFIVPPQLRMEKGFLG